MDSLQTFYALKLSIRTQFCEESRHWLASGHLFLEFVPSLFWVGHWSSSTVSDTFDQAFKAGWLTTASAFRLKWHMTSREPSSVIIVCARNLNCLIKLELIVSEGAFGGINPNSLFRALLSLLYQVLYKIEWRSQSEAFGKAMQMGLISYSLSLRYVQHCVPIKSALPILKISIVGISVSKG